METRIKSLVSILTLLFLLIGTTPAAADSNEPWSFDGGGWGHGVGLSQYGSQGMALDDFSAEEIIDFYYSGANVKTLSEVGAEDWLTDPEAIWVGLKQNQPSLTFEASARGCMKAR